MNAQSTTPTRKLRDTAKSTGRGASRPERRNLQTPLKTTLIRQAIFPPSESPRTARILEWAIAKRLPHIVEGGHRRFRSLSRLAGQAFLLAILTVRPSAWAEVPYEVIHRFGNTNLMGSVPTGPPIQGRDGGIYGAKSEGGIANAGVIYRLDADGNGYQVIYHFGGGTNGGSPEGALIEGSDGKLYGATDSGGGVGVVFRLQKDGGGFTVLHNFGPGGSVYANGDLIEANDGLLYGLTANGGGSSSGTVYRLAKNGSGYQELHSFSGPDGGGPSGGLLEGSDGRLYGVAREGGAYTNGGTVFALNKDGSGFVVLKNFDWGTTEGSGPEGGLIEGDDGRLYGAASYGGTNYGGVLFAVNKDGSGYELLHSFQGWDLDGQSPAGPLLKGGDGYLYGITKGALDDDASPPQYYGSGLFRIAEDGTDFLRLLTPTNWPEFAPGLSELATGEIVGRQAFTEGNSTNPNHGLLFKVDTSGSNYLVLQSDQPSGGDGAASSSPLIEGADGFLYGTTAAGGSGCGFWGEGTLFRVRKDGADYSILYNFVGCSGAGDLVGSPRGLIVNTLDGHIYGVAGWRVIYRISSDGLESEVIHLLSNAEGDTPRGGLVEGSDGFLYGTAEKGGSGYGTVFKLAKDGSAFQVLRSFQGRQFMMPPDGANPYAPVIEGSDGVLYGTTYSGGSNNYGTVFKINRDGTDYGVLHHFAFNAGTQTGNPRGSLLEGSDGLLYGMTSLGNSAIYRLAKDGQGFEVLRQQFGITHDNALIEGTDGVVYGSTSSQVFGIQKDGSDYLVLKQLVSADGIASLAALVEGSDGVLYGNTAGGGYQANIPQAFTAGMGTLFRIGGPVRLKSPVVAGVGGGVELQFGGLPLRDYTIERGPTPNGPWSDIGPATPGTNGIATATDISPPPDAAYYRVAYP